MDGQAEMGSGGHAEKDWRDDGNLKKVEAVVIILGCTLAATTYRTSKQRLLDVLNRSLLVGSRRIAREFLPLSEVEAFFSTGERERLTSTHINKSSILFVAERSGGRPDRSGMSEAEANLLRAKKALCTRIDIPPYILEGKMHAEVQEGLVHVIDGEETFLPMTGVSVSPRLPTGESTFAFVAINKHQIVRIEESQEVPKPPVSPVRKARRRKPKSTDCKSSGLELPETIADSSVPAPKAENL